MTEIELAPCPLCETEVYPVLGVSRPTMHHPHNGCELSGQQFSVRFWNTRSEAADKLEALSRENAVMREALKPFVEATDDLDDAAQDDWSLWETPAAMTLTAGSLRRARVALTQSEGQ